MTKYSFYLYILIIFTPVILAGILTFFASHKNAHIIKWSVSDLALVLFVNFIFKVISIILYGYGIADTKIILTYFSICQFFVELLLILSIVKIKYKDKLNELGLTTSDFLSQFRGCILFIIPVEIVIYTIHYIVYGNLHFDAIVDVGSDSFGILLLYIFSLLILAPFVEEVIFRGFAVPALKEKVGTVWSCLISSYMWSIYHQNLYAIISSFVFGIIYFLLYEKYKSIIPSILAHFLHNLIYFLFPVFL